MSDTPSFLSTLAGWNRRQWTILAMGVMGLFIVSSILFGQSLFLYLLALLVSSVAIFLFPEIGLFLTVVMTMWFERFFTLQPLLFERESYKIYPLDIILAITGISLLLHFLGRRYSWKLHRFDIPILLFIGVVGFRALPTLIHDVDMGLAFSSVKNYALYGIVYVFAVLLLKTKEDWKEFMHWFVIGGIGLFFFLFYGIVQGVGLWSEYTPLSTFGSRLIAGTHVFYLVLFGLFLFARKLWDTPEERDRLTKLFPFLLFLVAIGILVSLVRHLWIGLFVLSILWLFLLPRNARKSFIALVLQAGGIIGGAALLYVLAVLVVTGRIPVEVTKVVYALQERLSVASVVHLTDSSFGWRVAMWQAALGLWKGSPLFGIGFGYNVIGFFETTPFVIPVRDLHNNYLGILLQTGIIGFAAVVYWFWDLLVTLKWEWRRRRERGDVFERVMLFTWGNTILLFMILFSISVYWDINLFIIWWWIALAAVRWTVVERQKEKIERIT